MTDKELLDEIEKEFGSHTPADDSNPDDLDAFLADLKQTISPDSQPDPAADSVSPKKAPPVTPPEKGNDSHASADDSNPDDLDAFLADLKHTISPESQPDPAKDPVSPESAPAASPKKQKKEKPQRPVRKKEPEADPPKEDTQDVQPEKEPGGFTKFIIRHYLAINIFLLCLCLVLVGGIAVVILFQGNADPLDGKIMENVYIAGTDVGGMTKQEAYDAVNAAIGTNYTEGLMNVRLGNNVLVLAPSQTKPELQIVGAVEEAYAYGRTGSSSQRQQEFREAQFSPKTISLEPYLSLNTDYIRSTVSGFVDGFSGEYTPSGYTLEGEMPALNADDFDKSAPCQTLVLQTGTPGSHFDIDGICDAILDGYYLNQFDIHIPSECLPEFPETLDIDAIYQQLHVDAVEAVQDPVTGEVTPGSCGYTFPLESTRTTLEAAGYGQEISIPMEYIMPEKLDFNGSFTETLSSYSTPVSSNEAYNQNMKLLCQQLDGLILEPGESFSFDAFFKNRTEANGYQIAPRHGDKCADEEVGGGADQVATTLYVAAITADLAINQKNPADHLCDYTLKGTEISVSADWQDLKLTNSLKIPVKIRARVTSQQVVIQVLSEESLDYYIKLETKEGYTIPHGTVFVYKKSADGYTDGQVLLDGVDGCHITLQRVKYSKETDAEISRSTEYVEVRPLHTTIVRISG